MSKFRFLIMLLCAKLWTGGIYAQQPYPLTLEEIFELADQNSKTISTSEAAVAVAEQAVREARNGRLPDIDLSLSASYLGDGHLSNRDFSNGMHIDMPHLGNNFAIEAAQLIYGGGAVSNGIALARLQEEMATINLEDSRSRVHFMLVGFYLDLYKLQNILQVYERNIELAQQVIADTQARAAEGVALKNDVTRYELQLKNLELAHTRVENQIAILNADLVTMLGLPADAAIIPDRGLLERSLPIEGEELWQQRAESKAYALRRSALAVEMGERQERLARAERLPKLSVFAANHFDGPITIEVPVINQNFNYWYVGVGLSFRISSLYKAGKSVRRAHLATEQNRRALAEQQEQTSLAVKGDYIRYLEAYEEVATLEKSVQLAHENYAVIDNRYRNDIALVTDMLDAASERLDAELKLVNAQINVIFNYYKLKNTTGNL